jgi:hypothetical protein
LREKRRKEKNINGSLGFDGCNGSIDVFWNDVSSVQHTTSHVLAMTGVTFNKLVGRLKACIGDLGTSIDCRRRTLQLHLDHPYNT